MGSLPTGRALLSTPVYTHPSSGTGDQNVGLLLKGVLASVTQSAAVLVMMGTENVSGTVAGPLWP